MRLILPRHAAECRVRSRCEHSSKTVAELERTSSERKPDGNQNRPPLLPFSNDSPAKPRDTHDHQSYHDPSRSTTSADISQGPPERTICCPSEEIRDPLLPALPDNGSPQRLQNESNDQQRLEPIQLTAPVDINQGSPATSIYCTSSEAASTNDTSLCTDSDESSSLLDAKDSYMAVLHSKHMLLVDLMQEVYAIFDQRWAAKRQAHAGSSPPETPYSSQNKTNDSSRKDKKRCRDDRDSTPPNDGESRKRARSKMSLNAEKQDNPFACPFHKHEPAKYCCSVADGSKYRACVGPGFASIARLK